LTALAGLLLSLLSASPVFAKEIIQVGGTGTGIGVMKLLGAAYEKKHPAVHIEVLPSMGTPGGIKAALDGAIGLAISGRPLNDEELTAGAKGTEFARTPFVFVTNKSNAQHDITSEELVNIYSLKTVAWPNGDPIRIVLRPARETSSTILKAVSPDMEKAMAIALAKEGMVFAATDQDSAEAVAKMPGALGASTLTQVVTEKQPIKILTLNGLMPSVHALANGSYKLYKPLVLVTTTRTTETARRFAAFVLSAEARPIIEKAGNVTGPFH
jgi:phosphate transport system substrate-binding protein